MIETRRACYVLIYFCHSVFFGISSRGLIYIDDDDNDNNYGDDDNDDNDNEYDNDDDDGS